MTEQSPVLFLVDGSALAYRSHFAFMRTPLTNSKGLNTGAIMGYVRTLLRLIKTEKPSHLAVAFDTPEPTFRHQMYDQYKATRDKMPDEMRGQLPWMKRVTEALSIPLIERPGWEADDVIGTLAHEAELAGYRVMIVTGDKDFMQIVSDRVKLYDIMKPGSDLIIVGPDEVREKFGVSPDGVIDVLALMGDSSDNVPGVKGVGEKTARKLIDEHGSLEAVLAAAPSIPQKKLRENLIEHRDMALLSKRLVTIALDVPVGIRLDEMVVGEPHREELDELFKELEFLSLREELSAPKTEIAKDYHIVRNEGELDALIQELKRAGNFVMDTETTALDPMRARLVGFSFSVQDGEAYYLPLNLDPPVVPDPAGSEPGSGLLERLAPLLRDPQIGKIGQNIKYDMQVIAGHGIETEGIYFDTMIASYLLEPAARSHDLDSLSLRHCDYTKIKTSALLGTGKEQITMAEVPVETVGEYAAEDADFTHRLYQLFLPRLEESKLNALFDEIEMPLVPVLMRMERHGVRLDTAALAELETEITSGIQRLESEIKELAGEDFKINSPKQLSTILFEKLALHKQLGVRVRKTKTGFSTDQEVLESMKGHPLPAKIIEYRTLTKLLSTYVTTLPQLVHPETGRIHTSYNQAVAATGRLSSSDPNLQNIPIRTPIGRRVRQAFIATDDDHTLMSADYSQVELRILAHICQDATMIASFRRGADIHRDTAARVFGVKEEEVDADMRSRAKSINFGIIYGMGPQRLARETGMSLEEAQAFIARYFETFPGVRGYIDRMHELARKTGAVETLFGRRRPIPEIDSKNGGLRSNAENMAVNTPIQGTAADLIKRAMIRIDRWIRRSELRGRMILQVHDELVFDLPKGELEVFEREVPRIMSAAGDLDVPLLVDTGHGANWSLAH